MFKLAYIRAILTIFIFISASVNAANELNFKTLKAAEHAERNLLKFPIILRPSVKLQIAKTYKDSSVHPERIIKLTREIMYLDHNTDEPKFRTRIVQAHLILGQFYDDYFNHELARKEYEVAFDLLRPWDDHQLKCQTLFFLGQNQYFLNNIEKSEDKIAEAHMLAKKYDFRATLIEIYLFRSMRAIENEQNDSVEFYQRKIIEIATRQEMLWQAYKRLADVEKIRGNIIKAKQYSEISLKHALKTKSESRMGDAYANLAVFCALNNDFKMADQHIESGWSLLVKDRKKNLVKLRDIAFAGAVINSLKGNHEMGFSNLRAYVNMNEELEQEKNKEVQKLISSQSLLLDREKDIELLLLNEKLDAENAKKVQLRFWFIVIILLTLIIISIYIIFSQRERSSNQTIIERQSIELTQKKFKDEIRKMELKAVTAKLEGQEVERDRIAKDLHDGVGGAIAGIKLELESMSETKTESSPLGGVLDSITNIYNEVRTISRNLSIPGFENTTFKDNIKSLIDDLSGQNNLNIHFKIFPETKWPIIPYFIQKEIYRVTQEAITNILKHANATQVQVQFILNDSVLRGSIEDNGQGFNTEENSKGIGLQNIASRIRNLKGELNIDTELGQGTFIEFSVPVEEEKTK